MPLAVRCYHVRWLTHYFSIANLVLQDTIERIYAGNLFADIPRGIYLVRGENVLLLGEIVRLPRLSHSTASIALTSRHLILTFLALQDLDKEDDVPPNWTKAPIQEVFELKKKEDNERKQHDKGRNRQLQTLGFEPEHSGEIIF